MTNPLVLPHIKDSVLMSWPNKNLASGIDSQGSLDYAVEVKARLGYKEVLIKVVMPLDQYPEGKNIYSFIYQLFLIALSHGRDYVHKIEQIPLDTEAETDGLVGLDCLFEENAVQDSETSEFVEPARELIKELKQDPAKRREKSQQILDLVDYFDEKNVQWIDQPDIIKEMTVKVKTYNLFRKALIKIVRIWNRFIIWVFHFFKKDNPVTLMQQTAVSSNRTSAFGFLTGPERSAVIEKDEGIGSDNYCRELQEAVRSIQTEVVSLEQASVESVQEPVFKKLYVSLLSGVEKLIGAVFDYQSSPLANAEEYKQKIEDIKKIVANIRQYYDKQGQTFLKKILPKRFQNPFINNVNIFFDNCQKIIDLLLRFDPVIMKKIVEETVKLITKKITYKITGKLMPILVQMDYTNLPDSIAACSYHHITRILKAYQTYHQQQKEKNVALATLEEPLPAEIEKYYFSDKLQAEVADVEKKLLAEGRLVEGTEEAETADSDDVEPANAAQMLDGKEQAFEILMKARLIKIAEGFISAVFSQDELLDFCREILEDSSKLVSHYMLEELQNGSLDAGDTEAAAGVGNFSREVTETEELINKENQIKEVLQAYKNVKKALKNIFMIMGSAIGLNEKIRNIILRNINLKGLITDIIKDKLEEFIQEKQMISILNKIADPMYFKYLCQDSLLPLINELCIQQNISFILLENCSENEIAVLFGENDVEAGGLDSLKMKVVDLLHQRFETSKRTFSQIAFSSEEVDVEQITDDFLQNMGEQLKKLGEDFPQKNYGFLLKKALQPVTDGKKIANLISRDHIYWNLMYRIIFEIGNLMRNSKLIRPIIDYLQSLPFVAKAIASQVSDLMNPLRSSHHLIIGSMASAIDALKERSLGQMMFDEDVNVSERKVQIIRDLDRQAKLLAELVYGILDRNLSNMRVLYFFPVRWVIKPERVLPDKEDLHISIQNAMEKIFSSKKINKNFFLDLLEQAQKEFQKAAELL